jgi:hypothetical protein
MAYYFYLLCIVKMIKFESTTDSVCVRVFMYIYIFEAMKSKEDYMRYYCYYIIRLTTFFLL